MSDVTGILHLFSETGTEGGYWMLMNEEFITPTSLCSSYPQWDYKGLTAINSGDRLQILNNSGEVIDTIIVDLIDNGDQYSPDAMNADGMIIHNYPNLDTIDWEKWKSYFFGEYRARLTPEPELDRMYE